MPAAEVKVNRENFYILLELTISPPENDIGKINTVIDNKQAEWSRLRNHPNKGRQAQLYLDMLPEIKRVMLDDEKRKQEAEEARQITAKKEKEKFKELDEAIKLLSTKKQITEAELEKLAHRYSVPENVVRNRVKVPIVEGKTQKKAPKRLEPAIQKKISDALEIIGKKSLYEFLELSPKSTINTLIERTKNKDLELKRDSHKNAILTAGLELAGHCMNMFKSEEMRQVYDATLAYQQLEELNKTIDIAGMDGRIEVEEFDALVKKAREFGFTLEEAEEYIEEYGAKKNWSRQKPVVFSVEDMKQCGNCGLMNKSETQNCVACGYPLHIDCPNCRVSNPSTNPNCSKCGFPLGDMPNALPLIKEAHKAKTEGSLRKAIELLRQALLFWPGHPEAAANLREIESQSNKIDLLATELNELVKKRQYYKARQALLKLKQQDLTHPYLSLEAEINGKIQAAESWVTKAKHAAKEDDVMEFFSSALLECKDCQEAVEGMAKYPPAPPHHLKAIPSPDYISLQWDKTSSKGTISYRIVRKSRSYPLNALDGESLGETAQTFFNDVNAEPGDLYYYGIYAKRGEIFSPSGAMAGPVLRTAEVESPTPTPGDSVITLDWKAPGNAQEIEVWVKSGSIPSRRGDGIRLQGVRKEGVVVSGLKNGQMYGFRILAIFKDEKGQQVYSGGVTCQSSPVEPPPPVTDLTVRKEGNNLEITWTSPPRGVTHIISSQQRFSVTTGETIPVSKLSELGTALPTQQQGTGKLRVPVNFQGILYLLPVTVLGDVAAVGKAGTATSIDDVTNLTATINSGKLYLEWEWPRGVSKVLIMYHHQHFPTRDEEAVPLKKRFTNVEYLRNSAYVIPSPSTADYYFTVYAIVGEGENLLYSTGKNFLISNTRIIEVYYDITINRSFLGKINAAELRLFSKGERIQLPETLLVLKNGNLPIRKTDGTPILEIRSRSIGPEPTVVEIPTAHIQRGAFIKLFFKNDPDNQKYRIMSPSRAKLQIG